MVLEPVHVNKLPERMGGADWAENQTIRRRLYDHTNLIMDQKNSRLASGR
jgi:hypothetical protein